MTKTKPKTTTFYIKCSAEEAAAIRVAAEEEQRTVHNWLRMTVLGKGEASDTLKGPGVCIPYKNREVTYFKVGKQNYVTIPVEEIGPGASIWQAKPETGIKFVAIRKETGCAAA